ncbi:LLM class flavin-dependent oxidoreductase [Gordonia humi]|uniref:Alkanesulfonate monooxygenase SsuD/methylene tetrahydromethanopterin reductase-like flavin-dependent oxidoreductase (Luciferase family) n=1 Tax=Gordonia humi TaxID=686429 RepID=A0A840F2Z5_9ACTN|nr:LLM class flavin-dependent oxidoreductase [Gordonia humi]MBB4133947.1 alkanesulfonate monooxygenase SsuD/methylene tetrahydromethanopterin reductase-like flavin-dependent oxidoreductase (luciferase family) [Gordonia humi]
MRFGVCILPDMPWRQARPLWERAEQMGFDHAWTYDHLVWGGLPDSQWFSCIPTLTAAAAVTSRLRLGTYVASPNFRHPAAFAREIQTLTDISDDRLLVGLGVGGSPDSGLLGQPELTVRRRVDRFQEFVDVLDTTLTDDHVSIDGDYFSTRDMRLVGGEVRSRIPLILAGNGPRSVRFAARRGDGWVTTGSPADTVDEWFHAIAANRELLVETADGRDLDTYLSLDFAPVSPLASPAAFDDLVGRAAAIGFSDVIVHWPRDSEPYRGDVAVLDELASRGLAG